MQSFAGCSLGLVLTPGYVPPWQFAQPVVIPAWFIDHEANVVVLLWQRSQAPVVGMCVAVPGLVFTVTPVKLLPVS